jgi:hypothetical protein
VTAVREVEALVAEGEIRDLLAAQDIGRPLQLWNDGSVIL